MSVAWRDVIQRLAKLYDCLFKRGPDLFRRRSLDKYLNQIPLPRYFHKPLKRSFKLQKKLPDAENIKMLNFVSFFSGTIFGLPGFGFGSEWFPNQDPNLNSESGSKFRVCARFRIRSIYKNVMHQPYKIFWIPIRFHSSVK